MESASALERFPDHLVGLTTEGWALWKWVGLRGAGFPATNIYKLSAPAAAQAADLLFEAQDRELEANNNLFKRIHAVLDVLKQSEASNGSGRHRPLLKALSVASSGRIPDNPEIIEEAQALRTARESVDKLRNEFSGEYEASIRAVSKNIREIAGSERFREAVLWQNRSAFHTALDLILKKSADDSSHSYKDRQHEGLVANYLQRYCVKNDTIGFFGPVGWAKFGSGGGLTLRHGKDLVTDRTTYFEVWCIEALAKRIASNNAVRQWLKPIRSPFIRIEKTTMRHPAYGSVPMPAAQAGILNLCDGTRTAREIVRLVMQSCPAALTSHDQAYELIGQLESRGLLSLGFNISYDPFPEKILRQALDDIGNHALRSEALASLDELENARRAVAASAGNAVDLDCALERLDATFTRLTGMAPTQKAGKMYAARTLVYEDCRRDVEVEIGADLLKSLAEPLSLLLTSGRWLTFQYARLYRRLFKRVYDELAEKNRSRKVDMSSFWTVAAPYVYGELASIANPLLENFKKRWESILLVEGDGRRIQHSTERLRPRVLAEFSSLRAGWSGARYHSPDVIIMAPSAEHVNRGEYQFVLGEFHLGTNTLDTSVFFYQHPSPDSLIKARELDLPSPRPVPVIPKDFKNITGRTVNALVSPNDFRIEVARDSFASHRSKALPIASLFVEEDGGKLIAKTWDRQHQFDLIELIGMLFSQVVCNSYRVLAARPHTARISIDRLVISREAWRFVAPDLTFAFEKNGADRFLEARRWARAHGIPRFVFTKVPLEKKPCYLDLSSPVYVDIFSKMVRRTAESEIKNKVVNITEMLPEPDQVWLEDAQQQRYASEFRIVSLDLAQ